MKANMNQSTLKSQKRMLFAGIVVACILIGLAVLGKKSVHMFRKELMSGPMPIKENARTVQEDVAQLPSVGAWKLVSRQTTPYYFSKAAEGTTGQLNTNNINADNYAALDTIANYAVNGAYYFKLVYPGSILKSLVWKQTSNPWTKKSQGVDGYEAIDVSANIGCHWGGLEYNGVDSILDGSASHVWWFYAVGSFHAWGNGIPASCQNTNGHEFDTGVEKTELYVWDANVWEKFYECDGPQGTKIWHIPAATLVQRAQTETFAFKFEDLDHPTDVAYSSASNTLFMHNLKAGMALSTIVPPNWLTTQWCATNIDAATTTIKDAFSTTGQQQKQLQDVIYWAEGNAHGLHISAAHGWCNFVKATPNQVGARVLISVKKI